MKTNKKCSDRNDVANGSCALLSVSLYYRRPFFDVSKCARPDISRLGPAPEWFYFLATCWRVHTSAQLATLWVVNFFESQETICDNIFFFFFPFVSFDMWKDFGLLLPVLTSFVSRKVLPPTSRRLFGDQQDKNCAEETPVLTRKTSQVWCFRRVIPLVRSTIFWTTIFPLWKWHHFQRLFNFYFLPRKNTQRQLQQCCRGGGGVCKWIRITQYVWRTWCDTGSRLFFWDVTQIFRKKKYIFPLQWKTEGCKIFPQKNIHTKMCCWGENKKICLSGRLAATLFCVNSQWLVPTEFDEVHWRAHTSIQKRKRKPHHGGVCCHSVL